jgi:very-short-patch-repair endonuclease
MSDFPRDLRQRQTLAEKTLWAALRAGRLDGLKFRRQHPIGPYVVDFFCESLRLIVELDGAVHDDPAEQQRDSDREAYLRTYGYSVVRFPNEMVITQLTAVIDTLKREIQMARTVAPHPPR